METKLTKKNILLIMGFIFVLGSLPYFYYSLKQYYCIRQQQIDIDKREQQLLYDLRNTALYIGTAVTLSVLGGVVVLTRLISKQLIATYGAKVFSRT